MFSYHVLVHQEIDVQRSCCFVCVCCWFLCVPPLIDACRCGIETNLGQYVELCKDKAGFVILIVSIGCLSVNSKLDKWVTSSCWTMLVLLWKGLMCTCLAKADYNVLKVSSRKAVATCITHSCVLLAFCNFCSKFEKWLLIKASKQLIGTMFMRFWLKVNGCYSIQGHFWSIGNKMNICGVTGKFSDASHARGKFSDAFCLTGEVSDGTELEDETAVSEDISILWPLGLIQMCSVCSLGSNTDPGACWVA